MTIYTDYFPAGYLAVLPASRNRLAAALGCPVLARAGQNQVSRLQISGQYLALETGGLTLMWNRGQVDFHVTGRRVVAMSSAAGEHEFVL